MLPRQHITTLAILGALASTPFSTAAGQQRTEYEIAFPNAEQHEAQVTAVFRGVPAGRPLSIRMSRSSPGRYALHNFAKNVYDAVATDEAGRRLSVTRTDPHGWTVAGHNGSVRFRYRVWGDRTDGTYLGIDRSHAHLNMPATFAWAGGFEHAPIRLTIRPRTGWRIATQLRPTNDSTVFTAPNLQWFMDSPTEIGPFTLRAWPVAADTTLTIRLAVHHLGTEAEVDSFAGMAKRVVDEQIAVWGRPAPYDFGTYTFIADYLPWASGDAMEHRNSTILTSRGSLTTAADRLARLGALAHEFFHSWNVERLRPRSLEPFAFERENMSGELWFAEGFTNYYGSLTLRRAGFITDSVFAANLGGAIDVVLNGPGRIHFSAAEMSMQAPFVDAAVSIDPTNRQNLFISYYTWGEVLGAALDLTLRTRFGLTLDGFMREMWRQYGRYQGATLAPSRPFTAAGLRRVLGEYARDTGFANEFFRRYVDGHEVPDFERLLGAAGFLLRKRTPGRPYLGASLDNDSGSVFVNSVLENGSLYPAGVSGGDRIFAIDGIATPVADTLAAVIATHAVGDTVRLEILQRAERRTVTAVLRERPEVQVVPYESVGRALPPELRALRDSWLGSALRVQPSRQVGDAEASGSRRLTQ